ncbi:MAG: hypothetical protein ACLFSJ_00030 [Halorhodospira sp.]
MPEAPEQVLQAYIDELRAQRPADSERTLMWHLMKLVEAYGGDLDPPMQRAEQQLEQPPHADLSAWTSALIEELGRELLAAVPSQEALQASLDAKRHDPGDPDREMLAELEQHLPDGSAQGS